jgi:hypothetical protein
MPVDRLHSIADQAFGLRLDQFTASHCSHAAAGAPDVCEELDRYDIAVILKASYEWGGYRYTNASDAIAAAKRAAK